jgi:hypothetical protein
MFAARKAVIQQYAMTAEQAFAAEIQPRGTTEDPLL